MAQVLRRPHVGRRPHVTLNTDGRRHPIENALTALTVLLGLVSLGCALSDSLHVVGSWVGLAGVLVGLYGQLRSATTAERFVLVIFLGAAAVGFGLNMAHGGFL
jgi:protein-S-isoprenylcysteine O-methyltransferase Ste14